MKLIVCSIMSKLFYAACICLPHLTVFIMQSSAVEPVFKLDFENGFNALGRNGNIASTPYKEPKMEEGRLGGKALLSGPNTGCLDFNSAGIINPKQGAIEMWVATVDWTATEKAFHAFFAANDTKGKGSLLLYKYYDDYKNLGFHSRSENSGKPSIVAMPIISWQPGVREWHHVAITWSTEGQMLYLDGKPFASRKTAGNLPTQITGTFRLGDDDWENSAKSVNATRTSSTLLDDILIYDKELTPAQIKAHYQGNFNPAPLIAEAAEVSHSIDLKNKKITIDLNLNAPDFDDPRLLVTMKLTPISGDNTLSQQSNKDKPEAEATACPVKNNTASVAVALDSLTPENFNLAVAVTLDGKPAYQFNKTIAIPAMPWLGNSLGTERIVLPPWTPLVLKENSLYCWGREYKLEKNGLPGSIVSAEKNLLAEPIRLTAKDSTGQTFNWENQTFTITSADTVAARGAGSMTGKTNLGGIDFKTTMNIEYDGLLLIDIALSEPSKNLSKQMLEELSLEIPLNSEQAIYYHRNWMSGILPEAKTNGIVDNWSFAPPFIWLGDNDRGLFWFCETSAMWPNFRNNDAIQILRRGAQVILRLNLLRKGQALPDKWAWQCGIQATPVKPMSVRRRQIDLNQGKAGKSYRILWPNPNTIPRFGYPEGKEPELTEYLQKYTEKMIPYSCLTALSAKAPEWPFFGAYRTAYDWANSPDVAACGGSFTVVDPRAPGYVDFMVWKNHEFVAKYKFAGLYHDLSSPYDYSRDQQTSVYSFLAQRALYRRNYAMMKKLNPESFIIAHMSGTVITPTLAYVDAYVDGEQFRGKVKDSYLDVLPLSIFRTEFSGKPFGIEPIFLPQIDKEVLKVNPDKYDLLTREAIMLCLLHDATSWAWGANKPLVIQAFDKLATWGYADAMFIRYDDVQAPLADLPKDVFASAYKRKNGSVLLLICNLGKEAKNWKSKLVEQRLGIAPNSAVCLTENDLNAPIVNGEIEVSLKAHDFTMIVLK
jgi:hypothetical protein